MKYALPICLAAILMLSGCDNPPPSPEKIAALINMGAASTIAIGFVAIPDAAEANQIASLSLKVLDENILPLLNGDEEGLVNGLKSILELKAFDDPKLAKAKLVLQAGLPLLESYLPADLAEQGLEKIPADVKAYLTAFFEGARTGMASYLGSRTVSRGTPRGFSNYADLRAKLSAK